MSGVAYDAGAVREALEALRAVEAALDGEGGDVDALNGVVAPGTAPATAVFHERYQAWAAELQDGHTDARRQVRAAIDRLLAVDREYNDGELAAELGFARVERSR